LISTRIAESSSKKRKRGRPRKNENVDFGYNELEERKKIENKTIAVVCDDVEVQNKKKEEMEMVGKNGVAVDFVALGNMEDPYGEELRRRTEGMLGFSQGGVKSLEVNHLISTRIAESSSTKRKRGRPRKNENIDFGNNELVERKKMENKTIAVVCDDVEVQNKKKEEMEMEMVSKNGVVVDFVALGNMEDPYGEELRRRTEGMLGFSQGGVKSLEVNHLISTRIAESSSKKRKRGRPRKNENVDFGNNELVERGKIENKTIVVVCDDVEVQNNKKEEMEMVSKNGVVVDFVAFGNMEDPYGEELRRRTEGMQLKAEFLGFLEGFEGEWGSTRKKRRIVDASLFGDALPIGWKLSICVKKQAGRVWLACTRYIRFLSLSLSLNSSFC
jgi:mannose/fructose/N-acetylgalactosamine-specific phosphotransferase system component IIB